MAALEVEIVPALSDNYIFLIRDPETDSVGVVDPAEADPVRTRLAEKGWMLTHIFNTHHHHDHTGGNLALKIEHGVPIIGPAPDRDRITGIDVAVDEGDEVEFGSKTAKVFFTPGHTRGHIAFWFAGDNALFCGDTLFAAGCGRVFEGTPQQMWSSLSKLRALPNETVVYCAHEYTTANLAFAVSVDGDNAELRQRVEDCKAKRAANQPTIPSELGLEKRTNPFLRADDPVIAAAVGLSAEDPVSVFAEVRRRKDHF